ncbi:MAG TPA: sigma-70 family RNA polymerase sigma factor, partial [Thermoleophilaceae bacterium]|nr:sigma-70 family RNA polymerase sigma factor [Thermoleophilaceae bacterium]
MATSAAAGERARARPARVDAEPAVVELLRRHGGRLMSVARRYSNCREDAEDAYQRAVEILLVRAPSTDAADLLPWMKTVVKHEAFAVARQRARHGTPSEAPAIEARAGLTAASHEIAERRERLRLGAEALGRLKPQEVRALLLRADGLSYREICAATGWTYTKVNRCLSEGRRSFVDRVAGIERGAECDRLAPLVSLAADGEASPEELAAVRPHLSGCLACRARLREYRRAPS